ncbi:MAG: DUF4212 domain-containing protein [Planctomycetes bacterium]|nr:DUF4212 domain-containing protein [Planctomycetota bacterium]
MKNKILSSDDQRRKNAHRYWRNNKRIIFCILVVWFLVSFVLGIFFVESLNEIKLAGFPLGFWIAQQGSIYVFILLTLFYCLAMEYGDRKFHQEEKKRKDHQP